MNYIRGAVSAISAPYQYYKDLPPINPSTLTGAIDVIVIQRPTDSGDTELVCSPFHVRFGKWQVLRPGEKKVDVSVNGHKIPFNMKIGDAGEAFFVFETEEPDVPEDLITSPLLQPTAENEQPFSKTQPSKDSVAEPDFLDLNSLDAALPSPPEDNAPQEDNHDHPIKVEEEVRPSPISTWSSLRNRESEGHGVLPSPPLSPLENTEEEQDKRADEALRKLQKSDIAPEVQYGKDVTLDTSGYHASKHDKESSDATIRSSSPLPTSSLGRSSESQSNMPTASSSTLSIPFPTLRATSEPPLDAPSNPPRLLRTHTNPMQEYSWEWGNFPQPSPMQTTFPMRTDFKGKDTEGSSSTLPLSPDTSPERRQTEEYGAGGRLGVSMSDETLFRVSVDGRPSEFELSIIRDSDEEDTRGRQPRGAGSDPFFDLKQMDEFEAGTKFDEGKVDFESFLDDSSIVDHPHLVIRWNSDQYIRRQDESPLMHALKVWRDGYLNRSIRPASPMSEEDEGMKSGGEEETLPATSGERRMARYNSEPPDVNGAAKPPTSSSWVQWWRRRGGNSYSRVPDQPTKRKTAPEIPQSESAPAFPSTPIRSSTPTPTRPVDEEPKKRYVKTLRLTSEQLKSLNLKPGANTMTFALASTGFIACTARIFVWDSTDLVLISDIDGTITKSDGLGHVFAMIGRDWTHLGVAKLYTDICRNGYKIMYLTSRAIGQADATRDYLKGIKQNNYQLPEGPVIMSPDRLMASLHREVIMRKPEMFKMACLRDIQRLFGEAARNPFYAGFGNRITDALSYRSVNVPSSRIFTIDSSGEVKLELLELAGYKSSYIHMTDLVDQMFPPIHRNWAPEYTDFNYWKPPLPEFELPDLSPPSPALSARSDPSTFSRIRNFSLLGDRQNSVPPSSASRASSPLRDTSPPPMDENERELRQMSSFERLTSTLGYGRRSLSPEAPSSGRPDYVRQRSRSVSSMPGSLDEEEEEEEEDIHFGEHDDDDDDEKDSGDPNEEEVIEDFDEDLLNADEMQNVPFL